MVRSDIVRQLRMGLFSSEVIGTEVAGWFELVILFRAGMKIADRFGSQGGDR